MATKSLGTLTLDLIAKIGGFTGPMDQASRQAKSSMNQIKVSTVAAGVALGELAAKAVTSIPGAMKSLITGAAESAKEITNLSRIAGLSTTDFQKLAAGSATVGVSSEKLSDMLKDVNDKVGDFLNTGGGPLQDFFQNIAPKVGVTADQFRKLNSADALQLYVSSLEKANASQNEMTFYMEAIANDATGLIPLLRNNGSAWKELGNQAEAAGVIMSSQTIAAGQQFNAELLKMDQLINAAKTSIAAEFLPAITQFSLDMDEAIDRAGGLGEVTKKAGATIVDIAAFTVNAGQGVGRVFSIVADTIVGLYSTAVAHLGSLMSSVATGLSKITFGDTSRQFAQDAANLKNEAVVNFGAAAQAAQGIRDAIETPLAGDSFKQAFEEAKAAAAERDRLFGGDGFTSGTGTGNDGTAKKKAEEAAKAAAAAQKKIDDAYKSTATDIQRQIELINTSTDATKDATEADKIRFEIATGKLVGINAEQQKRLLSLADELDALEKLKKANEDQAKAESYIATLRQSNSTAKNGLDLELAGAGLGDKAKDRMKQDLQIQQDFNQQMADLQEQYNTKQISPELYAKETQALQDALAERLVMQQDYYNQLDDAQSNWMDGVSAAWENYRDTAMDYQQQAADFVSGTLDDLTNGTGDMFASIIEGQEDVGDAVGDLAANMAKSIIGALAKMAAQWLVYQAVQLVVGKSTQSAAATGLVANAYAAQAQAALNAFSSTAAIPIVGPAAAPAAAAAAVAATTPMVATVASAALAGMAHDGIDAIPETGTWLLQKGERVTTSATSAKLDRTLDQVQANASGGSAPVVFNAPVTVQAQSGMSDNDARAQGKAISDALEMQMGKFLDREMNQGGRLWRRHG